jgi:cytochrome bd ubiquinol oxidase subunit II
MALSDLWYIVLIASLINYAVLDGFDLGVGSLHLFVKKDEDRRIFLNAIGPVWDGNEVWLVIVIGAMFAGFPEVYATFFSSFYNMIMIFIASLIFRAAAIEFRSKNASPSWRRTWDGVFAIASICIAFGCGLILGNLIEGIPLNEHRDFVGSTAVFFRPYPLLTGIATLSLFMMHGAIYLAMKTEGELYIHVQKWINRAIVFFVLTYATTTYYTIIYMPHMHERLHDLPWLHVIPFVSFAAIVNIPLQIRKQNNGRAFILSSISIMSLLSLFAIGTYPQIIRSCVDPDQNSLFVSNSASSDLTLKVLLTIVAIGIPLVFGYGIYIYHTFKGKVKLTKMSY